MAGYMVSIEKKTLDNNYFRQVLLRASMPSW